MDGINDAVGNLNVTRLIELEPFFIIPEYLARFNDRVMLGILTLIYIIFLLFFSFLRTILLVTAVPSLLGWLLKSCWDES